MDDLDARLLDALLGDARASVRRLARDLDVAPATAAERLAGLEDDGVVEGYAPRVDYGALGHDVTAVVQLRVRPDALGGVVERLRDDDRFRTVYEVTGRYDVFAVGTFASTRDLDARVTSLLTSPGVEETAASVPTDAEVEHRPVGPDVEERPDGPDVDG